MFWKRLQLINLNFVVSLFYRKLRYPVSETSDIWFKFEGFDPYKVVHYPDTVLKRFLDLAGYRVQYFKCCPVICSITIYRAEDSGPDFSDDEMEYKDVKVC